MSSSSAAGADIPLSDVKVNDAGVVVLAVDPEKTPSEAPSNASSASSAAAPFGHEHYSHRLPWLRAAVLGANDGLVSTASIMLGVTLGDGDLNIAILSGVSSLVAGALAMAAGEYVSVASQLDSERADIKREAAEFAKGPIHAQREMDDLVEIYIQRGLKPATARLVAEELHDKTTDEIVKVHAREELGIDMEDLADPFEASWTSALSFATGAALPLLAGSFLHDIAARVISILVVSSFGLCLFGGAGALAGGAPLLLASFRVLVGGLIAMGGTMGAGKLFGVTAG